MLLTYYGFLVGGLIVLTVFNRSSVFVQRRRTLMGYLVMPPLVLLVSLLNLNFSFWATLVLTVLLILVGNWLGRYADTTVDRRAVYYALGLWLVEAVLPLLVRFTTDSRPDTRWWSLLIVAVILLCAPILLFTVWTSDMKKKPEADTS